MRHVPGSRTGHPEVKMKGKAVGKPLFTPSRYPHSMKVLYETTVLILLPWNDVSRFRSRIENSVVSELCVAERDVEFGEIAE